VDHGIQRAKAVHPDCFDLVDDPLQLVFAPRPEGELCALARERLCGGFADSG